MVFSGFSQTIEQTFDFSNQLFEQGNYEEAIESYKRVLFFDDGKLSKQVYPKIAQAHFEIQDYKNAASYFDLAYFEAKSDSLKNEILLQKTSCFLLQKKYNFALVELYNLPENVSLEQQQKQSFYFALTHFALNEFDKSKQFFLQAIDKNNIEQKNKIEKLFEKNAKIDRLKPKTAKILSIIVPGAGQLYAGDVKNALNSLLLNTALVYLGIVVAQDFGVWDAIFTVLPWYQRYYSGGYNNAEQIAINKIKRKRNKVFNDLLDVLSN